MENENPRRKSLYAAVKNKLLIAEVLLPRLEARRSNVNEPIRLLEIASGTGEHANCILSRVNNIIYQPTEADHEMLDSISAWTEEFHGQALPPVSLDVNLFEPTDIPPQLQPLAGNVDTILCINMIHISPWESTLNLFRLAAVFLRQNGFLLTYGAYRVNGTMVESNVAFDASLKARNPEWGIRDMESVQEVAKECGLELTEALEMPSNNYCLVFVKL